MLGIFSMTVKKIPPDLDRLRNERRCTTLRWKWPLSVDSEILGGSNKHVAMAKMSLVDTWH